MRANCLPFIFPVNQRLADTLCSERGSDNFSLYTIPQLVTDPSPTALHTVTLDPLARILVNIRKILALVITNVGIAPPFVALPSLVGVPFPSNIIPIQVIVLLALHNAPALLPSLETPS